MSKRLTNLQEIAVKSIPIRNRFALLFGVFLIAACGAFGQTGPLIVGPSQLTFNVNTGGSAPPQNLVVVASNSGSVNFNVSAFSSGNWLSVSPPSGVTPATVTATVNIGNLTTGTYGGVITITGQGTTIAVPVTLNVNLSGTSPFSSTPSQLTYAFTTGSTVPQTQSFAISSSSSSITQFTATPSTSSGGNWLTVSQTSASVGSTLTASVNPTNLGTGVYYGAIAIAAPGTTSLLIPVQVNVAGPSTLSYGPQQLSFAYQLGSTPPAPQSVTLTTNGLSPLSFVTTTSTGSCGNNWLVVSPQSGATPSALTIQINPVGLPAGTCTGVINVAAAGAANPAITIPVSLLVSTNPLIQVPLTGTTFSYQLGTAAPASQTIQVTSSGAALPFTVSATPIGGGPNFLNVTSSGTTPQGITLSVNPAVLSGLAPNTYAEAVTVNSPGAGNGTQTFIVTLVVSNSPTLTSLQQSLVFNYQLGQQAPQSQVLSLSSTGAPLNYTVAANTITCPGFLTASPTASNTPVQPGPPSQVVVSVVPTGLTTPQTCTGTVTLSVPGSPTSSLTIPVTFNISSTPLINLSPGAISAAVVQGSTTILQRTISLTSTDNTTALNFTATATTNPPGLTWLSVAPNTGSAPTSLSVTINPTNLTAGVYTGSINVSSSSPNVPPQTIPVTLIVGTGMVTSTPIFLSFNQAAGGALPGSQTIQLSGVAPGSTIGATVALFGVNSTVLSVTTSGNSITVTPTAGQLPTGTYTGVVTIFAPGSINSPLYIPITYTVGNPGVLTFGSSNITFNYQAGTSLPSSQTIQITSPNGTVPFTAVAVAPPGSTNGTVFLTVNSSGTTPGTLTLALNPAVLSTLAAGSYTNLINLTSPGAPGVTQTIPVTVNITAAGPPTVTAIVNAASYLTGAVSPGEIVSIFGTNIGPLNGLGLQLNSSNMVLTNLGTTSVTFNGVPAPLIFVQANQLNVVVPYELSGITSANVMVTNNGVVSASFPVSVVPAAPGIFTFSQNGSGPGAIVNQDGTVNGSGNAVTRGQAISIYATGEGITAPASATGSVTPGVGTTFPKPNAPVTVTIGGQQAQVTYAGEAPGLIAGVLQVNAIVPASIGTGNQPIVLTVGGVSTTAVVTVNVK